MASQNKPIKTEEFPDLSATQSEIEALENDLHLSGIDTDSFNDFYQDEDEFGSFDFLNPSEHDFSFNENQYLNCY